MAKFRGFSVVAAWVAMGMALPAGLRAEERQLIEIKPVDRFANEPVPPYSVKDVKINAKTEEISFEEAQVNLVVPVASTIQDDLHIRITDDGWAFLANVLKINLVGVIEDSDVATETAKAYDTLPALLNDEVIGIQEAFDIATLDDLLGQGFIDGCLQFYPRKRGSTATSDTCFCNDDADPTVTTKTADLNWGGQNWDACQNCYAGHVGNPYIVPTTPIWLRDPYDPAGTASTPKRFLMGPYFKEALSFDLWSGAAAYSDTSGAYNDGLPTNAATETLRQNVFINGDCKVDAAGNYPNGNCFPTSPKVGVDLGLADGTPDSLPAIVIQLNLYGLQAHGKLTLEWTDNGGCTDWVICPLMRGIISGLLPLTLGDVDQNGDGTMDADYLMSLSSPNYLHAKLYARMIDGYWTAAGTEGTEVASTGSGGGSAPPPALNCSSPPSSGTNCSTANDCPIGHNCSGGECVAAATINAEASNSRLLGMFAMLDPDFTKGGGCAWNSIYGLCATSNLNLDVAVFPTEFDFLNSLVESIAEPLVTDIVLEKLSPILGGMIGGILEDTVGLPIDFNQLFTGGPFTKGELCGLRDGQGTTPTCSADDAFNGALGPGVHPNGGRGGTCACDNQDLDLGSLSTSLSAADVNGNRVDPVGNADDLELNYMDNNDTSNSWGAGAGVFNGIVPGTATNWYDNQGPLGGDYGVARFGGWTTLGGVETLQAPYDIGAYVSSKLSTTGNKGQSILLDLAMMPKLAALGASPWSSVSCFGGTVHTDVTGPDSVPGTRRQAGSWDGVDNVLGNNDDWDDLDNTPAAGQHMIGAFSQFALEEVFYMLLTSGSLCFSVTEESLGGGIGSMLNLSSMKMLFPGLDPVTATTVPQKTLLNANTSVGVLLRPSGTPTVRVLGARNVGSAGAAGEWPNGDCIPNDSLNTHTNANLNILDEANTVGAPCTAGIGSYDLMIVLPHLKVQFFLINGLTETQVFEQDVDLVLTLAVEYTKTGPATTVFSTNYSKYLEVLVDVWLGCEGTVYNLGANPTGTPPTSTGGGTQVGDQTGTSPDANTYCGKANYNSNLAVNRQGVSSLVAMLLSTRLSLLARTTFLLDGLTMEFNKVGSFGPDSDVAGSDVGNKSYQRFGAGTGDWLAIAATLAGNLDLGRLFGFLGGSPAPYMLEPETYIVPSVSESVTAFGDPTAIKPGVQYNLTPAQSAELGLREYDTSFELFSAPAVAKLDYASDEATMRYSYSLDGSPWTPYRPGGKLTFKYMPTGFHILEVRAKDKDDFTDSSPAAVAFYVDSVAPTVAIKDGKGQLHYTTGTPIPLDRDGMVTVVLADNISNANDVRGSWSSDGVQWHPLYSSSSNILVPGDRTGYRQLYVKAVDEFGNKTQQYFYLEAAPEEDGFGCNATHGGQWGMLLALLGVGLMARRRRPLIH